MYRTDDPIRDATRFYNEQEEKLESLPICSQCGDPIVQEDAVYIDGKWICDECLTFLREEIHLQI